MPLDFTRDGAEHFPGLAQRFLGELHSLFGDAEPTPGRRIHRLGELLSHLDHESTIGSVVSGKLGQVARPVRAIAFDKTDGANWALDWHQDRAIAVRERVDVEGFGQWTLKQGQHHVQPPAELLARMATVRIHLDPVDEANAPLKIAPGSHGLGRVAEHDVGAVVERCGQSACLADAGDVWLYATLILHASEPAAPGRRRRVLQVDYAVENLPGGLEWRLA